MTQALIKYFLIIFILFSSFVNAKPSYTKNVQVRLDYFTKSCTNNKEDAFKNSPSKRPNTLILIDATNPLDESQKQFIRDNFLDGFEWGSVGEKVTVVLLNDESLSNLDFFTICTPLPKSKITKTMAFATLNELVDGFHQGLSGGFEELTKSTKEADKSKIIEALVEIFRNKRYNFLEGERRLIIASDLYQNSENLTFLDFCGTKSCQTFDQTLKDNNKFKTFLESVVSLKGANQVKVDIFHLKTHNRINLKSRNWWEGFLKHSGFSEGNVKVTTQL